ncbi:MAG: endonuclease NucS [Patescibacteria group bacterium]|nr:endonuclease NucS [Patescibacteria group bacterium]
MKQYKSIEVSEKQLEDLVRQGASLIEEGVRYVDHQRSTERGPLDVLMVDSGNALVVAELKVVEDDTMLVQGMDYYDYISKNIEGISRVYKDYHIDPGQTARLFLIAPSFSISLINRCKWIDIPISLFAYKCITFEDSKEITVVFSEVSIPSTPETVEAYDLKDRLEYITSLDMRKIANDLIEEIRGWDAANITIEPTKYDMSAKVSGRVFAYISPRRKFFWVYTYDNEKKWASFLINQKEDLEAVKVLLKNNIDRLR